MGFRLGNVDGRAVLVDGDAVFDLERVSGGRLGPDPLGAVGAGAVLHEVAASLGAVTPDARLADVVLGPPIPRPANVFGIGVNYRAHAAETANTVPEAPMVFAKFTGCLTGPTGDIHLASDSTDYEAELVVVIGATARDVPEAGAWDVVAGVTAGQDVSDRDLQRAGQRPQFSLAKSHDTYGPTGPYMVSPDLLGDRDAVVVRCAVNGEVRQDDTTANMIYSVPQLVAYLSSMLTLRPGDLIFTGTPSGVGLPTRNFLKPGDVVHTTIGGVGELVNRCV